MRKLFFSIFLIGFSTSIFGQYTDIINSNQPGNSQSAYALGKKVLQFEGGLWVENRKHTHTHTNMFISGLNYAVRYGYFSNKLEFMLQGALIYDYTQQNRFITTTQSHMGFYNHTLGAKYLIYNPYFENKPNLYSWKANHSFNWNNMIPAVAIYAGVNAFPNERYFYSGIAPFSPKVVLALQSHPTPRTALIVNIIANRFTTQYPEWGYVLTLTHNLDNGRFSIFAESEGIQSHWYSDHIIRLGGAYLFTKDIQVNIDLGASWKDTPSRYIALLGFSYRIDKYDKFLPQEKK